MSPHLVQSWNPETGVSNGAWFGVEHICPDSATGDLEWDKPRIWLTCKRCGYGVSLATRAPAVVAQ